MPPEAAGIWLPLAVLAAAGAALLVSARRVRVLNEERWARPDRRRLPRALGDALDSVCSHIGPSLSRSELAAIWVAAAAIPGLAGVASGLGAASLPLAAAGAAAVPIWASAASRSRRQAFDAGLGEVMPLISANLRTGASVAQAVAPVAEQMEDPIRSEFARLATDVRSGTPIEDALSSMAERTGSKDLRLYAVAVRISRQTGGSLADITDRVGETIRARTEMRRFVKAKTSLTRFEAKFLTAMPVVMFAVMLAISEPHREFFSSPGGIAMAALCVALDGIGLAVMYRMGDLETD